MKKRLASIAFLLAVCAFAVPQLKYSGTLAQSSPDTKTTYSNIEFAGITNDPLSGDIITFGNKTLFKINKDASLTPLLTGINAPGNMTNDGNSVWIKSNQVVARFENQNGTWKRVQEFYLPKPARFITIADSATAKGFAAKGKFFALFGNDIVAYDKEGKELGKIFTLPALLNNCPYTSIAIMPGSGDLLAASYYPDLKFYRFKADGSMHKADGWPFGGWVNGSLQLNGKIWGFHSSATEYPDSVIKRADLLTIGANDLFINGIASDGQNGYYLSTSQGIKHYPAGSFQAAEKRIGGSGKIEALALNGSTILVSLGNRLYTLKMDDAPDSPLTGEGNEPWRVAGNWSSVTHILVPSGSGFLLFDSKEKNLWKFEPDKVGQDRWIKQKESFRNLQDLAIAEGKLLALENGNFAGFPLRRLKNIDSQTQLGADTESVCKIIKGKKVWSTALKNVRDIAPIGKYAAVATSDALILIDLANGKIVFQTPASLSRLASSGKWLIASDDAKAAILRYKLTE